jgi:type I restriction enzyme S subunit
MSNDLLFEHFATLATAPDGIARLRELILQLAVQGELGTQDARDEPAIESYLRIKGIKNKESLKKIKGNFRIPLTWIYIKFKDGIELKHGHQFLKPDFVATGIPVIKIGQCKVNGTLDLSNCDYIDQNRSSEFKDNRIYKDDILMALTGGTLGKVTIVKQDYGEVVQNYRVGKFIPNEKIYSKGFTSLILKSKIFQNLVQDSVNQNAQPNIGKEKIEDLIIPLPPLAEQHRIVAKVDRLMVLCDELEARQQQERAGCLKLGTASLAGLQNVESPEEFGRQWAQVCDAFEMILDCPENVAVLRQTILQLAVQGRLVRQEPEDDPAHTIIKKLQKSRDYSSIESEEIPYSLPKGWEWERLGTLTKFIDYRGKTPNKILSGIKLITAKNVRMGYLNDEPREYISPEEYDSWMTRGFPSVGDLLFTTEAPMGNVAQISITEKFALAQRVINFHPYEGIFSTYLMYAIMSPFLQSCIEEKSSGVTARGIKAAKLKLIPIPLPPLAEQHRIVEKVDALMALCDALESRLKERAGVQGRLAGAVVGKFAN